MERNRRGVCHAFQKHACKFSHDGAGKQHDNLARDDDTVSHELDTWKKEVTQRQPLGFGLGRFFDQALQLVNLENACRQDVIRSLASDRGLNKVLELVSQNFGGMSEKAIQHAFSTQIVPFFRALSEEHVMSSPLLERHLGDICLFLYGVGGTRGEKLFAAVIQALTAMMPEPNIAFFTSLEATLAVLSKIIEFASTAKVTPIYEVYATTLAAMVTPQVDEAADLLRCQAEKHLDSINKRLGIGKVIRSISNVQATDAERPVFALQRSHPGRLVNGSPRHDNDFESIEDIEIMPTSEEIQSTHAEYLPLQDPSSWHKQGIPGLLDRHFRLLREDTIGQLRDSARIELEALQGAGPPRAHGSNSFLKKHTYHNALVQLPKFDPLRGLEFVVSFDQPPELLPRSRRKRQEWWTDSKRLEGDALICLLSSTQAVVFCSVCFPDDPSRRPKREDGDAPDPHNSVPSNVEDRVRVIARPVEMSEESIGHILGTFSQTHFQGGRSLVEFPGVLLPAFLPTLKALKAISKKNDLPFSDFLAPSQAGEADEITVLPPVYARRTGFRFSLDSITQDKNHSFDPSGLKRSDIENLQKASALDETQASALLSSLSRSFALIQGPPGTGKSYTGVALVKTLVSNRKTGKLGPILVVTFTNHALDQSLEHLLDQGITQIVRLGSRSKSERLTDLNLRKVAEKAGKTKVEKSEYGKTRGQMKDEARAITEHLKEMTHDTLIIRKYLARNNVRHDAQLFAIEVDKEGFKKVRRGSPEDRLRAWLHGGRQIHSNLPTQAITGVDDLYDLSHVERRKLYNHWLRRAKKPVLDAIMDRVEQFEDLRSNLDNIRNELDLRVLEQAEVIGVTTSGLARNLGLLRRLPSKILLCEEAGEVLESHLLTALLPSVEHAILIGDHLQLRPHVQCYELSQESVQGRQYALDTSLFERLVDAAGGGVRLPFSRLDTQRRMHPSISELVRSTLYPTLSDAASTLVHPEVTGMRKRLFWLDHQYPESHGGLQSTSHTNDYEVEMTTALVSHLIKQGTYKPEAIAVLTPYLGQLRKLRLRMQSSFEVLLDDRDVKSLQDEGLDDGGAQSRAPLAPGVQKGSIASAVRIATVDNFQGEEAEVVVISLVRSNKEQKCGFLRTSNRINVLLSRAKNGMFIIGNSATTQHIPMWTEVLQLLQMNGNFGDALELACPRHIADDMRVTEPDDFIRLAPDGGSLRSPMQSLELSFDLLSALSSLRRADLLIIVPSQRCPSIDGAACPGEKFCQECCSEEVKSRVVDLIMMSTYSDVDLNEEPCIFPACGHFYTIGTMDGHLGLSEHYVMDVNGLPVALRAPEDSLDVDKTRMVCPDCRRSLRDIPRYGRIVRRALLIQSTLKFITWSNNEYVIAYDNFSRVQETLSATFEEAKSAEIDLHLVGSRVEQMRTIKQRLSGTRYGEIIALRYNIDNLRGLVSKDEQPFKRVKELVRYARVVQKQAQSDFKFDDSVILQTRCSALTTALLLRCDLMILSDVLSVRSSKAIPVETVTTVEFSKNRRDCETLFQVADQGQHHLQQAEALIFWAQFAALEVSWLSANSEDSDTTAVDILRATARERLVQARNFCAEHPQARVVHSEIEEVEKMLRESTFYSPVTNEEMKNVVAAMAREFRGTGHWYRCENGHPFTVGECGMPMQTARCPQCGGVIGGQSHQPAAGVTHANDLEREFGNMRL
ncbi:hypothetical protein D6D12_01808 [Aureobasidium pullulans]|uniref:RZ-type domain-containing protein n=1 Tax=Aureobasidium pullulans TaxID=5580 RepID=A0AB74K3Q9_AURPU|nr:hypothetical protein D6D12_01808 [Aureobasidium pullulans]THX45077.1 hypothetical protein D6D11_07662 [Aureobasidium pullulans]